jgi:hypothetical protein
VSFSPTEREAIVLAKLVLPLTWKARGESIFVARVQTELLLGEDSLGFLVRGGCGGEESCQYRRAEGGVG